MYHVIPTWCLTASGPVVDQLLTVAQKDATKRTGEFAITRMWLHVNFEGLTVRGGVDTTWKLTFPEKIKFILKPISNEEWWKRNFKMITSHQSKFYNSKKTTLRFVTCVVFVHQREIIYQDQPCHRHMNFPSSFSYSLTWPTLCWANVDGSSKLR